jgi:hypothetical protein
MIGHRVDSVQRGLGVLDPMNDDECPQKRSRCRPIFLVCTTRHNLQRVVRQRPLQRLGLIPRSSHPNVAFLFGRQDYRHCLRVYRFDDRVRGRCQEAVDEVRAGDRFGFGASVAPELGPNSSKGEQRAVIIEREPHHILLAGRRIRHWRVF